MDFQDRDFNRSMQHLVELLKKLVAHLPAQPQKDAPSFQSKDSPMTMNFCFFNFLPMSPDEMDELEQIYDSLMRDPEDHPREIRSDLTTADLDFLRRHGIRY